MGYQLLLAVSYDIEFLETSNEISRKILKSQTYQIIISIYQTAWKIRDINIIICIPCKDLEIYQIEYIELKYRLL